MTNLQKSYPVRLSDLGAQTPRARLVAWHKVAGDHVQKGELLFSVSAEFGTLNVVAPLDGVLQTLVVVGDTLDDATLVAQIEPLAEPALRVTPKARAAARRQGLALQDLHGSGPRGMLVSADLATPAEVNPAATAAGVRATPAARHAAQQLQVDLARLVGSGPGGRIVRADVEFFAQLQESTPHLPPSADFAADWAARPLGLLLCDVDVTEMRRVAAQFEAAHAASFVHESLLSRAAALALRETPYLTFFLGADGRVPVPAIDLRWDLLTEQGRLLFCIAAVDGKDIGALQREITARVAAALPQEPPAGGCLTLCSLGAYEIDVFVPLLRPSESLLLGVGRVTARPVVRNHEILVRDMLTLSLRFDHRVADAALAARFLQRLKHLLEVPAQLLEVA